MLVFGGALTVAFCMALLQSPAIAQTCSKLDSEVLILGGGIAGISAGKTLSDKGITDFVIIEGGDDIGGRVKEVQFGGIKIEVGANWIHGLFSNGIPERNPLWPLKTKFDLSGAIDDTGDIIVYDTAGEKVAPDAVMEIMARYNASLEQITKLSVQRQNANLSDVRQLSALRYVGWKTQTTVESFLEWYRTDFCFAEGPDVTSLFATYPEYTYAAYGPYSFFVSDQRGYSTIIKGLANEYLTPNYNSDPRLHLNEVVRRIEWSDSCVCATVEKTDRSNQTYCAKTAIHTFSLGTLQAGTVEFVPPLLDKKQLAISIFDMVYFLKIHVLFSHSFWEESHYIGFAAYQRGYFPIIQPLNSANGKFYASKPPILLFTVTGRQAERVVNQPKNLTMSEIHQVLQTMYGKEVPPPVDIHVPDWIQNPLFHGMYANCPVDLTKEVYADFVRPEGKLIFSGEATDEDNIGYVQGGYLSGISAAHKAEIFLKNVSVSQDREYPLASGGLSFFYNTHGTHLVHSFGLCIAFLIHILN